MIYYIIKVQLNTQSTGYYTGNAIDSDAKMAKIYRSPQSTNTSLNMLVKNELIKIASIVKVIKRPKKRTVKKKLKNPIAPNKKRQLKNATRLYEDFTGHDADVYEEISLKNYQVGLKIGKCLGIMYEAKRDGETLSYMHEFKRASQPTMVVSFDGKQIFLINGNYTFKDDGINDT